MDITSEIIYVDYKPTLDPIRKNTWWVAFVVNVLNKKTRTNVREKYEKCFKNINDAKDFIEKTKSKIKNVE
jgi:hypothetical protein